MERGDISNEVPKRIAITESILLDDVKAEKSSRWRRVNVHEAVTALPINRAMLARTWQFSNRNGISWELVIAGRPIGWADALLDRINDEGMTGIARVLAYPSLQHFARDLAWRSYLIGVVDSAERRLFYGSRFIDPGQVA